MTALFARAIDLQPDGGRPDDNGLVQAWPVYSRGCRLRPATKLQLRAGCGLTFDLIDQAGDAHHPRIGSRYGLRREREARNDGKQGEQLAQHVGCQIAIVASKSMADWVNAW